MPWLAEGLQKDVVPLDLAGLVHPVDAYFLLLCPPLEFVEMLRLLFF